VSLFAKQKEHSMEFPMGKGNKVRKKEVKKPKQDKKKGMK